jgi:hypothetical protein
VVHGLIEFLPDRLAAVNHTNDLIQTFVGPAAGAVLFAASTNVVTEIHPVVAMVAGLLVAGGVHMVKSAAVRPAVSVTTAGAGNGPVSIAGDLLATILSILAIVIPIAVAALIVLLTAFVIWLLRRRANQSAEAR